ncbi:MAG: UDP-N-acetylmuramoyl-L-alanine--D-glutamate ligase [Kiritimatiellales bacterium]|nr:UDP-N-acetylmuramoyl-L-alanine--D-glutamate ligase [Kiritimatiellales bacterium]
MMRYRSALILGYGRSGRAAERLLHAEACETIVLTRETTGDTELQHTLRNNRFEVCVVSPGFSLSHPWVCAVRDAGVPLLSELELGWSRHRGRTVAVTGSNGKSTAVKWICEILQLAGQKTAIGGNYGIPACEVVLDQPDLDWLVLEVSSFQLETVREFRADIGIVLNVLPNHLDRHGSMENYLRTKARIFQCASAEDACLVPFELLETFQSEVPDAGSWMTFGRSSDADYHFENGRVFHGSEPALDLSGTLFESPVLGGCTGAAVAAMADIAGIAPECVQQAAQAFEALPHRLEKVGEHRGVVYINDSKATNLAAMAVGLQACGKNIHLIAGGLPKESDYTFVKEILAERVRSIYVIGQASRALYRAWNGVCPCVECGSLEKAFSTAQDAAVAGDTVLLSPGCASFDQFSGFEERGECFAALFRNAAGQDKMLHEN